MKSNPFATRFIRPGASPFLFLDDDSAEAIVERLKANRWRGQIIGEHGSGKSTLVATLVPLMEAAGKSIVLIKIGPGERRLPEIDKSSLLPTTELIVDGYEQLSWWSRWKLRWLIWRSGAGLVVTSHANVGLPTVYVTKSSEEVASAVVSKLLANEGAPISSSEITDAYRAAGGNVRETLFRLFDVYQQRQSPVPRQR
jgi:energy-coupling factor transporter ATP-binding protein EcfA2